MRDEDIMTPFENILPDWGDSCVNGRDWQIAVNDNERVTWKRCIGLCFWILDWVLGSV